MQLTEEFEEWALTAAIEVQIQVEGQSQQDVKPMLSGEAGRTQAAIKKK